MYVQKGIYVLKMDQETLVDIIYFWLIAVGLPQLAFVQYDMNAA